MNAGSTVVRRCLGCGAVDTPQPCLGTCVDRRLDLFRAEQHAAAAAAALGCSLADARALVERLARETPGEDEWDELRVRALLRTAAPAVALLKGDR